MALAPLCGFYEQTKKLLQKLAPLSRIHERVKKLLQMSSEPSHHLRQVQEDVDALQSMVQRIQAAVDEAEKTEIQAESVKLWLLELKGVDFRAKIVLGEYKYELMRANVEAGSNQAHHEAVDHLRHKRKYQDLVSESTVPIPLAVSFCGKIAVKIRKIRETFDEISRDHEALGLKEVIDMRHSQVNSTQRPPSSQIVGAPQIYGRKDELEKVINLLLYSDESKKGNLSVLPIVGMGGVGKTTLVQHVYNDQRISQHFPMGGWVCVSDDFTVEKLTAKIIESLTKKECHWEGLSVLQERLEGLIDGKLFLLVLDDVWNKNQKLLDDVRNEDQTLWESLLKSLASGAQGSAVVVTTRIESVAKMMQTMPFHRLGCLSVDDCWEVFRQCAFGDRDPSDIHPDLKEVGMKIVEKCGGLPLAAKSLGGLLRYESKLAAWEEVLQSDIWDLDDNGGEIIPALRLSYRHLPDPLKQFFVSTSMFPKDFVFRKGYIIRIWMAMGLLGGRNSEQGGAEDFGNTCFEELVQRSLFQSFPYGESDRFVMHDLIHDLARQISGGEFFHWDGDEAPLPLLKEVRHVFVKGKEDVDLEKMSHMPSSAISTIIIRDEGKMVKFPSQMMPPLTSLQALMLADSLIDELPDSIGDLIHLRYLSLDCSEIRRLPDSICKLYNLQTLSLAWCGRLERLPKDVKNLCNLKHLNIERTHFPFLPSGFGKLTSLRTLDEFDVVREALRWDDLSLQQSNKCEETCGGIKVLKDLVLLSGRLNVLGLQQVMDAEDAKLADLRNKRNLKELSLSWLWDAWHSFVKVGSQAAASSVVQTQVLENLQPPDGLQVLQIRGYGGLSFPSWMGSSGDPMSFSRLVRVVIESCRQCTSLPPLGQLRGLKYLAIRRMRKVEAVGSEFYGALANNLGGFPMLEELILEDMWNWVTWDHPVVAGTGRAVLLPRLRRLCIIHCWKLKLLVPLHLMPALEELEVEECPELMTIELARRSLISSNGGGPRMPALKKMAIIDCPRAHFSPGDDEDLFFQLPPTLGVLTIRDSPLLVDWCERGDGFKLANIPNARIWRTRDDGKKILTTLVPETWDGKLSLFIPYFPGERRTRVPVQQQDEHEGH